jgi:phage terminase small subunit
LLAGEAWDRHEEAREILRNAGLTTTDKHGIVRPHPAVQVENTARTAFVRCIRELGLDLTPDDSRPPTTQPRQRS